MPQIKDSRGGIAYYVYNSRRDRYPRDHPQVSPSREFRGQFADEQSHLAGYRDSAPVHIGNEAAFHQQFDIYGELMDAIYLYNKYGKPVTWEQWVAVREILGKSSKRPVSLA
jgi:GH15 family glucan-1,4-alpha-glucosidase